MRVASGPRSRRSSVPGPSRSGVVCRREPPRVPIRRIVLLVAAVHLLVAGAGLLRVWQAYQLQRDLTRAEVQRRRRCAPRLTTRRRRGSRPSDLAISRWRRLGSRDRTDGAWWGALTATPYFGDDAEGLRVLARTLSLVSTDGVAPMAESVDDLDQLNVGGRIDLDVVSSLAGCP